MEWERNEPGWRVPIKSWCRDMEAGAHEQAANLARHPAVFRHVAIMPDCHVGYGMPIGGVIACQAAVIPNAVGVDIGCGMGAAQTNISAAGVRPDQVKAILHEVKRRVPTGEGHAHRDPQVWDSWEEYLDRAGGHPPWLDANGADLARRNLGTLGGGNHFIELQAGDDGFLWLMIHSGSRNLGYRIAEHFHKTAQRLSDRLAEPPSHLDLAHLPLDSKEGRDYIRDMNLALAYARENRARIMQAFKAAVAGVLDARFLREINIHHNYAAEESHFGRSVWVHRKGATSARAGEWGIIPGSMGTPSYIVEGQGAAESFMSCSHGAGRCMGRAQASRELSREDCDRAMAGVVFDGWTTYHGHGRQRGPRMLDFGESPLAYKNIDAVINAEMDLIIPRVKLRPLGVVKG